MVFADALEYVYSMVSGCYSVKDLFDEFNLVKKFNVEKTSSKVGHEMK